MASEICILKFTLFLFVCVFTNIAATRSINETRISFHGSVFADLIPYGFQQCARECENSGQCKAFNYVKKTLRCILFREGRFSIRFRSSVRTSYFTSKTSGLYGKYAPGAPIPTPSCPADSKALKLRGGKTHCIKGCDFPPTFSSAIVTAVVSPGLEDFTRAGTVAVYDCVKGLSFVSGNITCQSNGQWSNLESLKGCSVVGACTSDADCVPVSSSVCRNGICECPPSYAYIVQKKTCVLDCKSLYRTGPLVSGENTIKPDGKNSIDVWCKNDWTLIHSKNKGSYDFGKQYWVNYKNGFGDYASGEYWIGLEKLNILSLVDNEIYVFLDLSNNETITLKHWNFRVYNESTNYKMTVSKTYVCNRNISKPFDSLHKFGGAAFSTIDRDNDLSTSSCASLHGAWWYKYCLMNLDDGSFSDLIIKTFYDVSDSVIVEKMIIHIRRM